MSITYDQVSKALSQVIERCLDEHITKEDFHERGFNDDFDLIIDFPQQVENFKLVSRKDTFVREVLYAYGTVVYRDVDRHKLDVFDYVINFDDSMCGVYHQRQLNDI